MIEEESRTNQGAQWTPVYTREWNEPFLLDDDSGVSVRMHGERVHVDPEICKLALLYESDSGTRGLPDRLRKFVQGKKELRDRLKGRVRAIESVVGEGDIMTVIGRLAAMEGGNGSAHRTSASRARALVDADWARPMSVQDLRRWMGYQDGQSLFLTGCAIAAIVLLGVGLSMM
ncbi:MAG: hypothetical protein QM820_28970 [Minicystis sp.]